MLVPKNKAHNFFLGFVFHREEGLRYGHQKPQGVFFYGVEKKFLPPSSEPPCAVWRLRINQTSLPQTATADGRQPLPRSGGKHNFVPISLVEEPSKPDVGKKTEENAEN